jgi:hypothetical protein
MTIGLSPKLIPACLAILVGFALILIDQDTTGLSVLLTGIGALGLGYAAPPGAVEAPPVGAGSDANLPAEAVAEIARTDAT